MDETIIPRIIFLVFLFGLSAFFAACEAAFFSLNPAQLAHFKENRGNSGRLIHNLLQKPKELLITIYIGNELVNIAISALITSLALHLFGNAGLAVAIGLGTFLILLFGEIVPKTLSLTFAERFSFIAVRPLFWFARLVQPIQIRFTCFAEFLVRCFGIQSKVQDSQAAISDLEFRTMVEVGEGHGIIEAQERELIQNVIEFGDKTVAEVMTPKIDMFTLKSHEKMDEILPQIMANFYSRVPVYDKDEETILGILFTKDLIRFKHLPNEKFNLKSIVHPVLFVPATKKLNDMLEEFKRMKRHLAVVLDEYGSVAGIVALEDILEELVGEIDSEMREEELPIASLGDNRYRMSGSFPITDFNQHFQCDLANGDYSTIGGFVFGLFGRVPRSGEMIACNQFKFQVEKMRGARILNLQVTVSDSASEVSDSPEESEEK